MKRAEAIDLAASQPLFALRLPAAVEWAFAVPACCFGVPGIIGGPLPALIGALCPSSSPLWWSIRFRLIMHDGCLAMRRRQPVSNSTAPLKAPLIGQAHTYSPIHLHSHHSRTPARPHARTRTLLALSPFIPGLLPCDASATVLTTGYAALVLWNLSSVAKAGEDAAAAADRRRRAMAMLGFHFPVPIAVFVAARFAHPDALLPMQFFSVATLLCQVTRDWHRCAPRQGSDP